MNNINKGSATVDEIRDFTGGKDIVVAYAKNQDNPREIGYEYWDNIKHPETGETLRAVKGYCNPNNTNQCYYAEYQDKNGCSWYYVDSRYYHSADPLESKSIREQVAEDKNNYKKEEFFKESNADKNIDQSSEKNQKFFDENNENESKNDNDNSATSNNQSNTNYNGQ